MNYEWDAAKNEKNKRRHGVSFVEALTVFDDELEITAFDEAHSIDEDRFITVGVSDRGRLLAVYYTERGSTARIISARELTRHERHEYEERR